MTVSVILIGIGILILLTRWIFCKNLDRYIRIFLLKRKSKNLVSIMQTITRVGNRDIAMGILVLIPNDKARLGSFIAIVLGTLIGQIFNIVIGQRRPPGRIRYQHFTNRGRYHSFASGHASGSFAFVTILAHYYPHFSLPLYIFATIVAVSRIYSDRHWFSNIVSGAIIGHLAALLVLSFY